MRHDIKFISYFYWDIVKYLFKLSTHALFIAEKMWKVRISKI